MLFNSFEFIFVFLPITLSVYFLLNRQNLFESSKVWLLFSSLFFYGWWNPKYVTLIVGSILVNYFFHLYLKKSENKAKRRSILIVGMIFNLSMIGYYKYVDFFIANFNFVSGTDFNLMHIILPLGISFFTFQQIAFLVDSYKDIVGKIGFINYALFVSFFPQLIAGPIVHHAEMMPQFLDQTKKSFNSFNFSKGLFVFNMGLAKKVILADAFGKIANNGYASIEMLGTMDSWLTSLFYTMQLYFDFSGYSDMAIGIGLFFNIVIPNNFWSPYKSENIKEFWRRWHMTLSRFLRDYVYIPLGGNRSGGFKTRLNLVLTFLIGGVWHGAGWTFVFWGLLHGIGLVMHSFFQKVNLNLPVWSRVLITFLFVNITWVFFRAESWHDAIVVLTNMFSSVQATEGFRLITQYYDLPIWLVGAFLLFRPNTQELAEKFDLSKFQFWATVFLIVMNIMFLNSSTDQEFLYFDF